VQETLPYTYNFPYKECYARVNQYTIKEMSREHYTITLTGVAEDLLVGDVIIVSGVSVTSPNGVETISCDGSYTIQALANVVKTVNGQEVPQYTIVTVEEEIPTDFSTSGTGAKLTKEVFISNIATIQDGVIIILTPIDYDLASGGVILIHTIKDGITSINAYTLSQAASQGDTLLHVSGSIDNYDFKEAGCPTLSIPIPLALAGNDENLPVEVLIDVTSVSEAVEEVFPMGEFMVNSYKECHDYLNTLAGLVVPDENIRENLYRVIPVGETVGLGVIKDLTTPKAADEAHCSIAEMSFKGLYSQIYSE
jgi:hypothetical protein